MPAASDAQVAPAVPETTQISERVSKALTSTGATKHSTLYRVCTEVAFPRAADDAPIPHNLGEGEQGPAGAAYASANRLLRSINEASSPDYGLTKIVVGLGKPRDEDVELLLPITEAVWPEVLDTIHHFMGRKLSSVLSLKAAFGMNSALSAAVNAVNTVMENVGLNQFKIQVPGSGMSAEPGAVDNTGPPLQIRPRIEANTENRPAPTPVAAYRAATNLIRALHAMITYPRQTQGLIDFLSSHGRAIVDPVLGYRFQTLMQILSTPYGEVHRLLTGAMLASDTNVGALWTACDPRSECLREIVAIYVVHSRRYQSFRLGVILAVLEMELDSVFAIPERDFFDLNTDSRVTREIENRYMRAPVSIPWTLPYGADLAPSIVSAEAFKTTRDFESTLATHVASLSVPSPPRQPGQRVNRDQTQPRLAAEPSKGDTPADGMRSTQGRCKKCLSTGHIGASCPSPKKEYDPKNHLALLQLYAKGKIEP